jgi:hypothetical protein
MKKFTVQLLVFFITCQCLSQTRTYSIIGSSTAAGMGASVPDSMWVKRVTHYYQSFGFTIIEKNLAVGGRNCYQGMPSSYTPPPGRDFPQPGNVTEALTFNPDVVLVCYPTNNYNFYSIAEIMNCLQTMKDSVNILGKICYITSSQPRQDGSFPDMPARTILKVIRDSIMNRFGTYAIDFFTDVADPVTYMIRPEYSFGDNIHLNDAGHRVLFQKVLEKNIFDFALPVHLTDFSIKQSSTTVEINWSVTDETAGAAYTLQRSNDAVRFENIFSTTSPAAKSKNNYKYVDANLVDGTYYYRLLITENGKKTYSVTREATVQLALTIEKVNMTSSNLRINIRSADYDHLRLEIFDMKGASVYHGEKNVRQGSTTWDIPIVKYPIGVYVLSLQSNSSKQIRQIFKKE